MKKQPLSITFNLIMVLLNALTWLVLGILIASNEHPALPDMPGIKTVLTIFSIAIAGLLLGLVFFLWRHKPAAYYLMLTFFILTSILTVFDEFGLADVVFLFISLVPIVLLIKDRNWYLHALSHG